MNKILLLIIFSVALSVNIQPQDRQGRHERQPMFNKKLEELEKIKLIEVLSMDEETTLKFFSRRNAHQEKMMELNRQLDVKSEQIENLLDQNSGDKQLKNLIQDYLQLESKIPDERTKFINSLSDILNEIQLARLIIFEKKFRQEIRSILLRERGKQKKNDGM